MESQGRGAALRRLLQESSKDFKAANPEMKSSQGRGTAITKLLHSVSESRTELESSSYKVEPQVQVSGSSGASGGGMGRGAFFARLQSEMSESSPVATDKILQTSISQDTSESTPMKLEVQDTSEIKTVQQSSVLYTSRNRPVGRGRANLLALAEAKLREKQESELKNREHSSSSISSDISTSLSQVSLQPNPPIVMTGSSGKAIPMNCNYVRLSLDPGKGVYEYEVKFNPEVDDRRSRFALLNAHQDYIGETKTFDGTILYLPHMLPDNVSILKGNLKSDGTEIKMTIIFKKQKVLGETIHLYNVLFRRIMNHLGYLHMGRNFYDPNSAKPIPAHLLEVWPGFITAVNEYEGGIMLCCDVSHRVLRTSTVLELMDDMKSVMKDHWRTEFTKLIVGKVVLTRYNNRTYRVDDVTFNSSPLSKFLYRNDVEMSYIEYYKKQYNLDIRNRDQPLLISQKSGRMKGVEVTQNVHLIPELSYITGLTDTMRADLKLMKDVAQNTRVPPSQRQYALNKFIKDVNSDEAARKTLSSWGLKLEEGMVSLPGRILHPEDIYLGKCNITKGSADADWNRAVCSNPVLLPVHMTNWLIVFPRQEEKIMMQFTEMLKKVGPVLGMRVHQPQLVPLPNDSIDSYLKALRTKINPEIQIVIVLMLFPRADKYSAIKRVCCSEAPVPSQVILRRTLNNPGRFRSVSQKVALQMNCKLGGTLWSVKIPLKNTMVCGIDVYHDNMSDRMSYAAVVCSLDPAFTKWFSKVSKQGPGLEIIDGLIVSFIAALTKFKEVNDCLPNQILIYRDGVGDGQLAYCQDHELKQIQKCLYILDPQYNPKLLYVVVQKNINTRMFLNMNGDYENPLPGSIMDHTITRRNWFDFFLISQSVRQGTVSPSHYVVIHNSTLLNPDQIQRISYKLTHLYYNWPGTIRIPAPCQYAHKLAYLVGESLHKEVHECLWDKLYYL